MQAKSEARGTGRTTRSIIACLLAAMAGRRILYVCATDTQANLLRGMAEDILSDLHTLVGSLPHSEVKVGVTDQAISMYRNGELTGKVYFRGLDYAKAGEINIGLEPKLQYQYVYDHYAQEVMEQERLRLERVAAEQQIILLMKKHGLRSVMKVGEEHSKVSIRQADGYLRYIDQPE